MPQDITKIKAELEYEKYLAKTKADLSPIEKDFIDSLRDTHKKLRVRKGTNHEQIRCH